MWLIRMPRPAMLQDAMGYVTDGSQLLCNNQNGSIHCQILDSPEKLSYSLEPQNAAIVKISCMFWNGGDKI